MTMNSTNPEVRLADDGKPYISVIENFRDLNGEVWRVRYQCGTLKFQITDCHGYYVLLTCFSLGNTRETRYTTFDRAYRGILAIRRRVA